MTFTKLTLALSASFVIALIGSAATNAQSKPAEQTKAKKQTVVTVKAGDTLSSIAKKHKVTYVTLFNANKSIANPDQIDVGDKIRVPAKSEKLPDRFSKYQASRVIVSTPTAAAYQPAVTQSAPVVATTYTTQSYTSAPVNSSSYYVGNGMWCTDYVHSKRPDVAIYGNAGMSWIGSAQAAGKSTGSAPRAGAVAVTNGHVAYVEKVNSDGSYVVSEMGWNYQAGNYNKRTVQPGTFGGFIY
jgi:surface antigen